MSIQWDRSLSEWSSGLRPAHFHVIYDEEYRRSMKDSPWERKEIDGASYYGKSLEGESWKQIKTGLKIVTTGLAFLPVLTIPLLIWLGAHEKIVLWGLQLHTNSKLMYKITHQPPVIAAGNTSLTDLPNDMVKKIFTSAISNPEETQMLLGTLGCLTKDPNFYPNTIKEDLRLDAINQGKLKIHDIPELNGKKKKILKHIVSLGKNLKYLELEKHVWLDDDDLKEIVKACPNLKTLIYSGRNVSSQGTGEILKLTQLEVLHLYKSSSLPASLDSLSHLKELLLDANGPGPIPSLDGLPQLEKLTLYCTQNIPSLDQLVNLKELRIVNSTHPIASLNNLVGLEKLSISSGAQPIPSLDALINLVDLTITNSGAIPSLQKQEKLTRLEIRNHNITQIDLTSQAPLQELILKNCRRLQKLPDLDQPEELHTLSVYVGLGADQVKQYSNLRRLTMYGFTADLMNHLPHLEELSFSERSAQSELDKISLQQKQQLKKININSGSLALFSLDEFVNLEELKIENSYDKTLSLEKNTALKKLTLQYNGFKRIKHLDKLAQLTHLKIQGCYDLKLRKASVNPLENLTDLKIIHCPEVGKLVSERLVRLQRATIF